ncbi:MAG: hypothetical protein ACXVPN_00830 [Bacteroidia bacterium]
MRKLTFILFCFAFKVVYCQDYRADFEFGHLFDDEFYCEYTDNHPNFDLTADKFFEKRKKEKIKKIVVTCIGESLDSLYLKNPTEYHRLVEIGRFDHGFTYVETICFDTNGFTISKTKFPQTIHLNKQDSVELNKSRTSSKWVSDSLIVSTYYYSDSVFEKLIYRKNIICRIRKQTTSLARYDSTSKSYTYGDPVGFDTTKYIYGKEFTRIEKNAQFDSYKLEFKPIQKKIIQIKCTYRENPWDSIRMGENRILKNDLGQIVESRFYPSKHSKDYSTYFYTYDQQNNLVKITRKIKEDTWLNEEKILYTIKNTYEGNKLLQAVIHCEYNPEMKDFVCFYNERGFLSGYTTEGYKVTFKYY